jgi:hypothetical protein
MSQICQVHANGSCPATVIWCLRNGSDFCPGRDLMNVAWQFTPWTQLEKAFGPVRVRCATSPTFCLARTMIEGHSKPNHTVSTRRVIFSALSQAVNCLATFVPTGRRHPLIPTAYCGRGCTGLLYWSFERLSSSSSSSSLVRGGLIVS